MIETGIPLAFADTLKLSSPRRERAALEERREKRES